MTTPTQQWTVRRESDKTGWKGISINGNQPTEDRMSHTPTQKTFTAHYRYRQEGCIGPQNYFVDLNAANLKEAKRIAKSWEGRDDRMMWFMGVERKVENG